MFKKVKLSHGPDIFTIYIHYEDGVNLSNHTLKITNTSFELYCVKNYPYRNIIEYKNKEYMSYDEYFNFSTLYDIPSPDELKEIRKYGKKFLKNSSLVFLGFDLK